jgi:DNA repair exonuclease SbcCD ATPase subunit
VIAKEAGVSFRDIGAIKKKAEEEKEASKEQADKVTKSTQASKLFSEGKSPVQVAIALNLQEPEVARFYVEYWRLRQLYSLNKVYEEIKDDIGYFVRLYALAKVARMDVQNVINLLEIANNDLPSVEHKCERLKRELDDIEAEKRNSIRIFQQLNDQIISMCERLESIIQDCEKQMSRLQGLQQQTMKLKAIVRQFENNNEEYVKIRKAVEEKIVSILSDAKPLLRIALLSLTESMRKDQAKYNTLIFCDNTSSSTTQATAYSLYYDTVPYGQRQQQPLPDYISMLIEEAEKLYNKLTKEMVNTTITDYASSILSSLPMLSQSDEE